MSMRVTTPRRTSSSSVTGRDLTWVPAIKGGAAARRAGWVLRRGGQCLSLVLGHDGGGLGQGGVGPDRPDLPRHHLVDRDGGALEGLAAVLVPVAERDHPPEYVQEARSE